MTLGILTFRLLLVLLLCYRKTKCHFNYIYYIFTILLYGDYLQPITYQLGHVYL